MMLIYVRNSPEKVDSSFSHSLQNLPIACLLATEYKKQSGLASHCVQTTATGLRVAQQRGQCKVSPPLASHGPHTYVSRVTFEIA